MPEMQHQYGRVAMFRFHHTPYLKYCTTYEHSLSTDLQFVPLAGMDTKLDSLGLSYAMSGLCCCRVPFVYSFSGLLRNFIVSLFRSGPNLLHIKRQQFNDGYHGREILHE